MIAICKIVLTSIYFIIQSINIIHFRMK